MTYLHTIYVVVILTWSQRCVNEEVRGLSLTILITAFRELAACILLASCYKFDT